MSTLQAGQAEEPGDKPPYKPGLTTVSAAAGGAAAVLVALVVLALLGFGQAHVTSGAETDVRRGHPSPAEARRHRQADALYAQHGTYVRDPYGCVYMFQYLAGSLSLAPVQDEHGELICNR